MLASSKGESCILSSAVVRGGLASADASGQMRTRIHLENIFRDGPELKALKEFGLLTFC